MKDASDLSWKSPLLFSRYSTELFLKMKVVNHISITLNRFATLTPLRGWWVKKRKLRNHILSTHQHGARE
jgi:hypothetical protein